MIKRMKTKFITSFIMLIILMTTLISYQSYANTLEESYIDNTGASISDKIDFNTYDSTWYLFCCQYGQHIPSYNNTQQAYIDHWKNATKTVGELDDYEEEVNEGVPSIYVGKEYKTDQIAYYALRNTIYCTPKSAYILNLAKENSSDSSRVQHAWWTTKENKGAKIADNDLAIEAKAYQEFVKKIATNPADIENTETYQTLGHQYEDGATVSIKFPEIDKSKLVNIENNSKDVTVCYDEKEQKYLIGPFSIQYAKGTCNNVDFGTITGFDIYTDASNEPVSKEQWEFVWKNKNHDVNNAYPDPNDEFYIKMDYIQNATKITGMYVDYKYLIAGGQYQELTGTYDRYVWKLNRKDVKRTDKNGNSVTKWQYTLEAKDQNIALESQQLGLVNSAARWYETTKISLGGEIEFKEGYLSITKKALDENGNEMTAKQIREKFGEDQYFDFRVKITYGDGSGEYATETVKAGTTVKSGPYRWKNDESAPTYEVEEIQSNNEDWKYVSIENGKGTLEDKNTVNVIATNKIEPKKHSQTISLTKKRSGKAEEEENFYFNVTVTMPNGEKKKSEAHITIPKGAETGNTWVSEVYTWFGDKKPEYEIAEIMSKGDASKYPNTSITPAKGKLDGTTATFDVNAYNYDNNNKHEGILELEKLLENGQVTDEEFKFNVKVEGAANTKNGIVEFPVIIKAGKKAGPYKYVWEGDTAPTFTITEIDNSEIKNASIEATGGKNVKKSGKTITGQLSEKNDASVNVKFTNNMTEHSGGIKVIKDIQTEEKISKETLEAEGTKFEIEVVIEGTFVHDGKTYENTTKVITKTLPDNGKWEFEVNDVKWYGSKAPVFTVTEKNLPTGWKCKVINYSDLENESTNTEGHKLVADKTVEATIINELPTIPEYDLTFSMAGLVWVDSTLDEKNGADEGYYTAPNGVYDEGETLKENTEVTVYRVVYDASGNEVERKVATAYKDIDNNELAFPIITKSDGKWNVPRIPVPALTEEEKNKGYTIDYDVEFTYDAQTYEPTEFLSYKIKGETKTKNQGSNEQKANEYINATTAIKDQYARDSMALASPNNANYTIAEVSGKTEIDSNGNTTGIATLTNGEQVEITYTSENAGNGYPTISKVNTLDDNGMVLDIFKARANTSAGNLTFPFEWDGYDGLSITNIDKKITENGVQEKYKFHATYNYCLNINLGLKERPTVDIGLTKKLDNAKVIVKEKMYQYNYSGYYDLTEEKVNSLDKDIKVDNANVADEIQYTLGLYRSDYYYRAEMYINGTDKTVYDRLENFYKTLNKSVTDTEMDIYLTYKITLANNSSKYDVMINSLDDYYDSSFTLVKTNETKYLKTQTVAGTETDINAETNIAKASDYADKWTDVKTGIAGSDKDGNGNNIIYNKMTANDLGIKLSPAETKDISVTFKVNKKDANDAKNAIVLGQKCNVVEIASYSTFDAGTNHYAGKIDRDSAPSNLNISTYNNKAWYEDDTFAAPRINVNFVSENADRTINGLAWEDNSKDKNTENPEYNQQVGNGVKDSGEDSIEGLTTELVEKVMVPNENGTYTEYDYIWPTDQAIDSLNGKTMNQVTGLDTTITTSNKGEYTFKNAPAGDYVVRFTYGDNKINSANYSTAKYYNGQDFKSARFKGDLKEGTQIQADSYLDIDKINANGNHNTAVDSEARRLQVVANSREIMYGNGAVMGEYQDELFTNYYMWADTPKLDINLEMSNYDENNKKDYVYAIHNVNFGLEERPNTELTLDKQIEEITLTTSDGNTIMDAKYNINYTVADDGNITANVELDTRNSYGTDNLQALNRDLATNQGFRYINVDSTILEGTTITVKYKFTVLNTGEVDRTGKLATMDYKEDKTTFDTARNELLTKFATYTKSGDTLKNDAKPGEYVGNIYYYGAEGNQNDAIVTTTVRQLVDYIDNDTTFSGTLNATTNTSWSNVTATELKELIKSDIVQTQDGKDTILDEDGIQYETENRNNLVVSVDSTESTLNNSGFIAELVPYQAKQGDMAVTDKDYQATMYLTTTKYTGSDSDDLQIDNVAEIIKYNNKVGRRDESSIPGNVNPAKALETKISLTTPTTLSAGMQYERDTSATEVITLSPPTGSGLLTWKLQVLAVTTVGLSIIVGGIVLIKKKVLK